MGNGALANRPQATAPILDFTESDYAITDREWTVIRPMPNSRAACHSGQRPSLRGELQILKWMLSFNRQIVCWSLNHKRLLREARGHATLSSKFYLFGEFVMSEKEVCSPGSIKGTCVGSGPPMSPGATTSPSRSSADSVPKQPAHDDARPSKQPAPSFGPEE